MYYLNASYAENLDSPRPTRPAHLIFEKTFLFLFLFLFFFRKKVSADGNAQATVRYPSMKELSLVLDEAVNIRVVEVRVRRFPHVIADDMTFFC